MRVFTKPMSESGSSPTVSLSIPEELLLLSLDDEQGKLVSSDSTVLRFVLAGAVLDELALRELLWIRNGEVCIWPNKPLGDPILDLAIERFAKKNNVAELSYWIQQLSKDYRKVRDILLEKLVTLGALKKEEHHFLWVFPYNRYPVDNSRIEDRVRLRIRHSLFSDDPISNRDAVILSLIHAGKLEGEVFGKEETDEARERISHLKKNFGIGSAVTNAILDFEFSM
jgi:golgi phosphoprotein 3